VRLGFAHCLGGLLFSGPSRNHPVSQVEEVLSGSRHLCRKTRIFAVKGVVGPKKNDVPGSAWLIQFAVNEIVQQFPALTGTSR
jgi:hypothetical protein